jgi:3-oxoacyl-[acyl-carrier protein] reductase
MTFDVADRKASQAASETDIAENGAYYGAVIDAGITDDAPMAALKGRDLGVISIDGGMV